MDIDINLTIVCHAAPFAALKDLRFVVKALSTLSSRWEMIGVTVKVDDLDRIKKEHQGTNSFHELECVCMNHS